MRQSKVEDVETARKSIHFVWALICFAVLVISFPSLSAAYDFSFEAYGPNRVVRGYDVYIQQLSQVTDGTRDYAFYYVEGLPAGVTKSYPELEETCCGGLGTNKSWQPQNTWLMISVPPNASLGSYELTLRIVSAGIEKKINYLLYIDPVPEALPKQKISSIHPIPSLAKWESYMTTYGAKFCNREEILRQGLWEGNLWYYDGIRVYHQIADYTGQNSWNSCADYTEEVYKPYIESSAVPGWRVFPHGLYQDFLRNKDAASKFAAIELSTNSAFARTGGSVSRGVDGLHRETAYLIHAYRIAGMLGSPNLKLYLRSVNFCLGMIDQMFVSKTDSYLKPFMVGLIMEALIQYYEESKDPRVPTAIKVAADGLWSRAWIENNKAFYYESTNATNAAPDLNLLIAPAYAWLYKITGDPVYQQRGDAIFEGGVEKACPSCDGKHFNQNYRWSFDYVTWRSKPFPQPPMSFKIIETN
jgi:hypothetical protein